MEEARSLSNMRVHGRASSAALANLYAGAALLACTSKLEGFPTTFLEAWSLGVPVVTTFDPDSLVAAHGLGEVAANLHDFITKLKGVLGDPERRENYGAAARNYYDAHHSVPEVSRRFHEMFQAVAKR
jgi:glycosyltransferase involved in cell wall biosynthesis